MWINPQAVSGDSVVLGKFWNATMTSPYYQYGLELASGTPIFYVGATGGVRSASMGSALALNQWSHLAVVFNGSQAQFYVNGTLVTTASLPATTITARNNGFRLGADANTQQFFKGSLDDVRIYGRALTQAEVQTDMATSLGAPPAPDTIAPTVSLSGPAANSTQAGTVTVSANAADNVGVVGVQFLVDGANLGAEDATSPYSISWNTTTASNGLHTLAARARDAAGNATTTTPISVTVDNQAPSGTVS